MSIRFDANADVAIRTTSLPSTQLFTVCFWARRAADTNAFVTPFNLRSVNGSGGSVVGIATDTDGDVLKAWLGSYTSDVHTMVTGEWFFVGLKSDATTATVFARSLAATSLTTATGNAVAFTPAVMTFGNRYTNGSEGFDGSIANIVLWDAVLDDAEILLQSTRRAPVRTADLHAWWPCLPGATERLRDYSGNTRDLTAVGTLTDEDGPPVSWGGQVLVHAAAAAAPVYAQTAFRVYNDDGLGLGEAP